MAYRLILAALLALASTPASAGELIAPLIISLLALPATFTVLGFTFATASVISALVTTAIGVGVAILFAPRPQIPPPESGIIAIQQNLPYRIFAVGRARVAGAIMLKEEIASQLVYVAALVAHYIDGFEDLYLNDDKVTIPFDISGNNFIGNVSPGSDGRYSGNTVYIETRQGLATETVYSTIETLLPTIWDVDHRGDGQASIGMFCAGVSSQNFLTTYPYGGPSPSVVGRWAQVYDWRDLTQSPTDSTTWKWSDNPALQIVWFMCFSTFGYRYNFNDAILPVLSYWTTAADDCDEIVPLKVGSEKRYRSGGWITTQQARNTTLLTLLQTCDGFLSLRGAVYVLIVGKYQEPTVTLIDADIAGFLFQSNAASEDVVNEIVAYWTDADNGYVTVDTDPSINMSDQALRGGAPRKAQLQLTWVQSVGQASRLKKREMFRQIAGVRGKLILHFSGINACYERWIKIQTNTIPQLNGAVIENRKPVISIRDRMITIDYILSGPGIDDYDPSVDESAPPYIPQRPDTVGLPIPSNVTVVAELYSDDTGVSSVILALSWDEPFFNGVPWVVNYEVQYRFTDGGGGQPGPWTQQSFDSPNIASSRVSVDSSTVPEGTSLDVQIASVGAGASLSTWSSTVTVSTVLANIAPSEPIWISATGGIGTASLSVTAPSSVNVAAIQFYRGDVGDPFSTATAIGSPVSATPNATVNYTDTVLLGSYDYWAVSLTSVSVASAPAGPETATVT